MQIRWLLQRVRNMSWAELVFRCHQAYLCMIDFGLGHGRLPEVRETTMVAWPGLRDRAIKVADDPAVPVIDEEDRGQRGASRHPDLTPARPPILGDEDVTALADCDQALVRAFADDGAVEQQRAGCERRDLRRRWIARWRGGRRHRRGGERRGREHRRRESPNVRDKRRRPSRPSMRRGGFAAQRHGSVSDVPRVAARPA